MDQKPNPRRKWFLIFLLFIVPALLILGWAPASLNLAFLQPDTPQQTILLLAVYTVIFLAFVIFALILLRNLLKLYVERRQQRLGARFKTKMVAAFLGLSLVPVSFLFIFAYGLLNRSIDKWFGVPFDIVRQDAQEIFEQVELQAEQHALHDTLHLASDEKLAAGLARRDARGIELLLARQLKSLSLETVMCFDAQGQLVARAGSRWPGPSEVAGVFPQISSGALPAEGISTHWQSGQADLYLAASPVTGDRGTVLGGVVSAARLPTEIGQRAAEIQRESAKYDVLSRERKAVKRNYLLVLWLLTLLILFVATWFAIFLSKQVTVPIQALAQGTEEISKGNLGYQITVRADDELGRLIVSFNEMTRQLQENRQALERAARELQEANRELEERTKSTEAILENIPTGVISFDRQGRITQVNSTVDRMFGRPGLTAARSLADLFSAEDAREISRLFRRAARQGVVTRQMELDLGKRRASVALTISSIRARHGTVGAVLVLEDLTELLRAQKAAAWQEVAQRIAHEIKNPLTPIQLSTERIRRLVERASPSALSAELVEAVAESASLIGREVATLKTLVAEFSSFARFPASHPVPSSLNAIIENALNVFDGRLSGVEIHRQLAPELPTLQADPEQMKRAVVNLIDNAAEAIEQSALKEISVRTALDAERDVVELVVADSGPGISPEDKARLFLPFFSTKRRGTGLGLAIVSRIVSEHNGSIRVEENQPAGTKIVIELPVDRSLTETPEKELSEAGQ